MSLSEVLQAQQKVITRRQALRVLSERALDHRLGRQWQVELPGVYVAQTGPLTTAQRHLAGLLYAGEGAMLDDLTALRQYRVSYLPKDDGIVRLLVPAACQRQSRQFIALRRTIYLPEGVRGPGRLRYAPIERALTDFALRYDDERTVRAVLLSAVQRRQVSLSALDDEYGRAGSRGRRRFGRVLEELHGGARSAPEGDIRRLVAKSRCLPEPLYNCLLELPDGRRVSPDLLIEDAGLVHETNGSQPHTEGEFAFDDFQARHDAMTVAGLTVLHNSPRQIASQAQRIIRELEHCYRRDAGKGLPTGVTIVRRNPPAS